MKEARLLSALIHCNLNRVHFPGIFFTLKYRFLFNCFMHKLKTQQNTSPILPSQEDKLLTSVQVRRKKKTTVLNSQGHYENEFIHLFE